MYLNTDLGECLHIPKGISYMCTYLYSTTSLLRLLPMRSARYPPLRVPHHLTIPQRDLGYLITLNRFFPSP